MPRLHLHHAKQVKLIELQNINNKHILFDVIVLQQSSLILQPKNIELATDSWAGE